MTPDQPISRAGQELARQDIELAEMRIRLARAEAALECSARKQGTSGGNEPADCNWPFCGCDPKAEAVLAAIAECGMRIVDANLLNKACQVLEPFAKFAEHVEGHQGGWYHDNFTFADIPLTMKAFIDARTALDAATKGP